MLAQLLKLGLSEKEAKVYLAALELGAQTAQEIARRAGVNRATTYVILQMLMRKGLASTHTRGKKTYFNAEPPEQLDHLLRKQEEEIFEHRRDLEVILPELKALAHLADGKSKVRFFEGREGVEVMLEEVFRALPAKTRLDEFLALNDLTESFPKYETVTAGHRIKRDIRSRVIYTHPRGPQALADRRAEDRTARHLTGDTFPFGASILILPDQHQVVIVSTRKSYAGVVIDNPELTQTLASIFAFIWSQLAPQ